ncbi:class I SAM-dependent methyltransferase [Phytohabitans rumicis]|uniref:Methyltransferase n=1 Tax=Phytohabitans rumicis TaxID=1076125 RepID=A0A6V8KYU2_9ACTN|nr:class I SAM-dependent methyltransferase [Phytohabitans rumicis]GFJ88540.1 methyltransferase [Phytohabitans rumicis]
MTASQDRYTFDNAAPTAAQRVRLLAESIDGHTTEVLAGLGIAQGWRCLEVGPGAGTITAWLAARVGPRGRVTALDLDPRHVPGGPTIEVRQDDVRTAALPDAHFDLIHARLVLMHLPERDEVLRRLAGALRPGGLLVVSDWDTTWRRGLLIAASDPAAAGAFDAYQDALANLVVSNGGDLAWASRVPLAMRSTGLVGITGVGHNRLHAGGDAGCLLHAANTHQLADPLRRWGLTVEQIERVRAAMAHPDTLIHSYWLYTTVGRRPEE